MEEQMFGDGKKHRLLSLESRKRGEVITCRHKKNQTSEIKSHDKKLF